MATGEEPRLVTTEDGVEIALYSLGGTGSPLLIAHATGFHGRAYQPFADALAGQFRSEAIDERGHGMSGLPPDLDFDWNGFGLDVLAAAPLVGPDRRQHEPIYGFGHSAGGAALIVAELARPGTFRAIYCFEPIIFPSDEPIGRMPDGPLSVSARRRREIFESRQAAIDNYSSKPPLNALDGPSLAAYVEHGFEDLPDGTVRLRCRRESEAEVYAAAGALDVYRRLGEVSCQVVLVGGETTDAIRADHLQMLAERLPMSQVEVIAGMGHFGPLEDHDRVARSVIEHLMP